MEHSENLDKLAVALAKAQGNIQTAHKSADNPFFKSKYADMASCWDACREPLSKEGLSVVQMPTTGDGEVIITTLLLHSSGQWIKESMACKPAKNDAQAMGSVATYLRRYMLMGAAGIAPAEDDGNAAARGGDKNADKMTPTKRQEEPWTGKLGKTALRNKLRDFDKAVRGAEPEIVQDIIDEYKDVLEQTKIDYPVGWEGDGGDIAGALGAIRSVLPEYGIENYDHIDKHGEIVATHHDALEYVQALYADGAATKNASEMVALYEHNEEPLVRAAGLLSADDHAQYYQPIYDGYRNSKS